MRRRTLLQAAASTAVVGCGGGGGATAPDDNGPVASKPNVLMIAIDDLNDWTGYLKGHPQVKTPHLDALAARSTVFERAYCNSPTCSASRPSALTGLSVQSTGVWAEDQTFHEVNPGKDMLWGMMTKGGYESTLFGKVNHQFSLGPQPMPAGTQPFANRQCFSSRGPGAFDWGPTQGEDSEHPDYRFAQQGIDTINSPRTKPFFLAVGFVRTHVGWYVPQRFFDMYPKDQLYIPQPPDDDLNDLGPTGKAIAERWDFHNCITRQGLWADAVQAYLASISWVDSQVGRLINALNNSPHANNTMIVLWSDNGFHLGQKFHWMKQALWEESTRVPFLISLPKQTSSVRQSACVSLRDMTPTILDYCQVAPSYPMDGVSLRPLIESPTQAWNRPVLTTHNEFDNAIRTERWRYIRYENGERELYDVQADSAEHNNLAGLAGYEAIMADLERYMPPRRA